MKCPRAPLGPQKNRSLKKLISGHFQLKNGHFWSKKANFVTKMPFFLVENLDFLENWQIDDENGLYPEWGVLSRFFNVGQLF